MNSAPMKIDLRGRVNNLRLGKAQALLPLFEAIYNSIQAIEESNSLDGKIEIHIERENEQNNLLNDPSYISPIQSFKIIDNGVGFNKENFESFLTSDSTLKMNKGNKGIGRFLWLKVFKSIEITSNFSENGIWRKR